MSEPLDPRPLVLTHCEWSRDRDLVSELLATLGIQAIAISSLEDTNAILEADRVDLILVDTSGGFGPLTALLRLLDDRPESADLPLILMANTDELPYLSDLTTRRFNALLLAKPMSRDQLAAAVESGLRLRARQRQVRSLLAEVSASNHQLATANLALEQKREESAEDAQRKTRFLAAISHDIRTPVNAIVLSCQLLRMIGQTAPNAQIDAAEIDELTDALLTNASALVELVDDLLDIARHDQGKLEFVESEFLLDELLQATLAGLQPLADQKRLTLTLTVATPGAWLRTDRVKMTRILQNLVANAIKFTEVGHVRVTAAASTRTGLRLEVEDSGVGIPEAMRAGIFDEFAQLQNPERDRTKGTGLGLAICRRLVAAMGGTIAVEASAQLAGSLFVVTLPPPRVARDGDQPSLDAVPATRLSITHRGDVLIVEDHEPSRMLLQRLLNQAGLLVRTAANGQEALRAIDQARPDLVLMDLMMPVLGGREALRILRNQASTRDLTVIILTGDLGHREPPDLSFENASAYLSKPIELPMLYELLDRFLPVVAKTG